MSGFLVCHSRRPSPLPDRRSGLQLTGALFLQCDWLRVSVFTGGSLPVRAEDGATNDDGHCPRLFLNCGGPFYVERDRFRRVSNRLFLIMVYICIATIATNSQFFLTARLPTPASIGAPSAAASTGSLPTGRPPGIRSPCTLRTGRRPTCVAS